MPNWCSNRLTVRGPGPAIAQFREQAKYLSEEGEERDFRLSSLFPMPEILLKTEKGSDTMDGLYALGLRDAKYFDPLNGPWAQQKGITTREQYLEVMQREKPDALEKAQLCATAREQTGFFDWYDWAVANWGTKWDATGRLEDEDVPDGPDEEGYLDYWFDSAWSPPEAWLKQVGSDWPTLEFRLKYEEEGEGFMGVLKVEQGEVVQDDCINF